MPRKHPAVAITSHDYEFHYRIDGDRVRIWKPTWFGDQFEVLTSADFDIFKKTAERCGIFFVEQEDD